MKKAMLCSQVGLLLSMAALMNGCLFSNGNKQALKLIEPVDADYALKLRESEVMKKPFSERDKSAVEMLRKDLAQKAEARGDKAAEAGWPLAAQELYRAAYEMAPTDERLAKLRDSELSAALAHELTGRALMALELGHKIEGEEIAESIPDSAMLFPSPQGLEEAAELEARHKKVDSLVTLKPLPASEEYLEFLRDFAEFDPSASEVPDIIAEVERQVLSRNKTSEAQSLLDSERFAEARAAVEEARDLDPTNNDASALAEKITIKWAFDEYDLATRAEVLGTKRGLKEAHDRFAALESSILPGYRDVPERITRTREVLSDLYANEASDFLRWPRLLRISSAKACNDRALEWNAANPTATAQRALIDLLEAKATEVRIGVVVDGSGDYTDDWQGELSEALKAESFPHATIVDGGDEAASERILEEIRNAGYTPWGSMETPVWDHMTLRLTVHEDIHERNGDDLRVTTSSSRINSNAGTTVPNPTQITGARLSTQLQTTRATLDNQIRELVKLQNEKQGLWDQAKATLDKAQAAFNTAQSEYNGAVQAVNAARTALAAAEASYAGAQATDMMLGTNSASSFLTGVQIAQAALAAAELNLNHKTAALEAARGVLNQRQSEFNFADAVLNAVIAVKQKADEADKVYVQLKQKADSDSKQATLLPHDFDETYRPTLGSPTITSRFSARGYLVHSQGDVVLVPLIVDIADYETELDTLQVDGTDQLGYTPNSDTLRDSGALNKDLQQRGFDQVLASLTSYLENHPSRFLTYRNRALEQGHRQESLEWSLRYLRVSSDTDSNRAELEAAVDELLMESLTDLFQEAPATPAQSASSTPSAEENTL